MRVVNNRPSVFVTTKEHHALKEAHAIICEIYADMEGFPKVFDFERDGIRDVDVFEARGILDALIDAVEVKDSFEEN